MKFRLLPTLMLSFLFTACGNQPSQELENKKELALGLEQLQANLTQQIQNASMHQGEEEITIVDEEDEFERVVKSLKKQSHIPNITEQELQQGWYPAAPEEKKYATPRSWVYDEKKERWIHPDLMQQETISQEELMCRRTGGTYTKSCIELETTNQCQYIPQSTCQCPEKAQWDSAEGCLQVNEQGSLQAISKKELEQGYYNGLSYQKKKGTPSVWIWNPEKSIWHSPHLLDFSTL